MIETWLELIGEGKLLALVGLVTGLVFGISAQHSRFCLRSASAEMASGTLGPQLSIWLLAFFSALLATQLAIATGVLDVSTSRQIATAGSLSGAVIGGILFGSGMVLARGCASRLLVLSATGNLRALVTGLVVTLVAQSALTGLLAPARESLSLIATVDGGDARDVMALSGLTRGSVLGLAALGLALAMVLARHRRVETGRLVAGACVGIAVALGWVLTHAIASASFEIVPIGSITFTGPSTDTLMALVNTREITFGFGIGLVPGVVIGSMSMALMRGEWRLERFGPETPMERYLVGAVMMGFGAMLAGGCAVGAGITGGAVLSLTAWVAVGSMWAGALLTQAGLSLRGARHPQV